MTQNQRHLSTTQIDITSSVSLQSVPNIALPQQQVIFVDGNYSNERMHNHEFNNNLPLLTINIPNSLSSSSTGSSFSAGSSSGHMKYQCGSPKQHSNSFLG